MQRDRRRSVLPSAPSPPLFPVDTTIFMAYDYAMTIKNEKLSVKTAATLLNVRPARVRTLIRTKKLRGLQHGISFRWSVSAKDLDNYITKPRLRGRPIKANQKEKSK